MWMYYNMLSAFNLAELGVFVVSVFGAIALIVKQVQQSKCKTCKICWGLSSCERELEVQVAPISVYDDPQPPPS